MGRSLEENLLFSWDPQEPPHICVCGGGICLCIGRSQEKRRCFSRNRPRVVYRQVYFSIRRLYKEYITEYTLIYQGNHDLARARNRDGRRHERRDRRQEGRDPSTEGAVSDKRGNPVWEYPTTPLHDCGGTKHRFMKCTHDREEHRLVPPAITIRPID